MNVYLQKYVKGENLKKIRFGSFPLVDMNERTRYCLDSYLIKSFADKIAISSTLGTISRTERAFITPNLIRKYFTNELYENSLINQYHELIEEANNGNRVGAGNDKNFRTYNPEQDRIKRAFEALKNLNANITNDPFYKNNVNFPIYIENSDSSGKPISYDFLLLTNDLLNKSSIREINYSDNITLIILFLKIILAPHMRVSDLGKKGDSDSSEFRSEIVKLIEFAQQKGTNPISLMFMILISVSKSKKLNGTGAGLIKTTSNYIQNAFGEANTEKARRFFDDKFPHTKSINFLLNEVKFDEIKNFFDDLQGVPGHIKGTQFEKTYSANNAIDTGIFADPIFRQFMMQKTEQYNSILSLMNALFDFNANNNLYVDVDNGAQLTIQTTDNQNAATIQINQDEIIQVMENEAMVCFMNNLRNDINYELDKANINFLNEINSKISKTKSGKAAGMDLNSLQQEINTVQNRIANNRDPKVAESLNAYLNQLYKQVQTQLLFNSINQTIGSKTEKSKIDTIKLDFNLRTIQAELTDLYTNAIVLFLNENNISGMIQNDPIIKDNIEKSLIQNFETLSAHIIIGIREHLKQSFMNTIKSIIDNITNDKVSGIDSKKLLEQLTAIETKIDDYTPNSLLTKVKSNFDRCIYDRMVSYFGNTNRFALKQVKDATSEKNIILKKLTLPEEAKKFKSFILTEKILIDLYHLVYFYDTQRYIGGIINTPPSTKIFNVQNQIKYIIKRLGLENNIVYIIGKNNEVTLQMPDFLSLTGAPIFEKIVETELKARCLGNWEKQMWTDPSFSDKVAGKSSSINIKDLERKISDAQKEITKKYNDLSNTKDETKQNSLKNAIKNLEKTIEDHNSKIAEARTNARKQGVENLTIRPKQDSFNPNGERIPGFADEHQPYYSGNDYGSFNGSPGSNRPPRFNVDNLVQTVGNPNYQVQQNEPTTNMNNSYTGIPSLNNEQNMTDLQNQFNQQNQNNSGQNFSPFKKY